jgi:hypothetical protein
MRSNRSALALLVMVGCNDVFGLRSTVALDAQYFDAPIDAPYACPMLGTAPAFEPALHQRGLENCREYVTTRAGHGFAKCRDIATVGIFEGPIDGPMTLAAGVPTQAGIHDYDTPRPSPDGERLLVREVDVNTGDVRWQYYARQPDRSWMRVGDPPFAAIPHVSTMAQSAAGYHVLVRALDESWEEWLDEAGTWRSLRVHPAAALVAHVQTIAMTSDGLRALVTSSQTGKTLYSDRASIDGTFRAALPIDGSLPGTLDAYMTEDCARMFVSGLGYVFFVHQR